MEALAIALGTLILYLVAYHTYGKWLGKKIFKLSSTSSVPSQTLRDDTDYVPTNKKILFGHHFTSIAGTGPIVGPAIAVMWGWLPALLWVLLGSIFIGAVHDFGSLVVSLRNHGQTVGDIAGNVLTPRVRILFLCILLIALTIVLAIFGLVIATVFRFYPQAIFPCLIQIPLALMIGIALHRKGIPLLFPSVIALILMYLSIYYGNTGILGNFNALLAQWPNLTWVATLLLYSYIASVLPVWALLQPRDYINSLQLLSALGLVTVGLVVASFVGGAPLSPETFSARPALELSAPAWRFDPVGAPALFPFLFITIACGAISGFHCMVSSGTSSKQLRCETDAQFVGYGSMLTEGFLATIVILSCAAGLGLGVLSQGGEVLTGITAWESRYGGDWGHFKLPQKIGAFVDGSGNFLRALGLPTNFSIAVMGVLVASFALTTIDTCCRLQRYVIQEFASIFKSPNRVYRNTHPLSWLTNKHGATLVAIGLAFWLACIPGPNGKAGTGGLILWPLFGATNQLLGGLAFLVITFWMWRNRLPNWFVILPTLFMLILPAWALFYQIFIEAVGQEESWLSSGKWTLILIAIGTLAIEIWMLGEAMYAWSQGRKEILRPRQPSKV